MKKKEDFFGLQFWIGRWSAPYAALALIDEA
jgi:hypothetical protein